MASATNHKTIIVITKFNQNLHTSSLMCGYDFTWITEVENRNADDVLEKTISPRI